MVKRSPTLGTFVSTKTKCIKLIFIGKITLVPVAFFMALSIYLFSNVNICGPVIAYLENITNLEILPYLLHFSEDLKRILIIKYFVG